MGGGREKLLTRRTEREERTILNEIDKEEAKQIKKTAAKKAKEVEKARKKLGAGRRQPDIMEQLRVAGETNRNVQASSRVESTSNALMQCTKQKV